MPHPRIACKKEKKKERVGKVQPKLTIYNLHIPMLHTYFFASGLKYKLFDSKTA